MAENELSKRFFYEKFLIHDSTVDNMHIIQEIEKYARSRYFTIKENVARNFISNYKKRWNHCGRNRLYFENKNKNWLNDALYFKKASKENSIKECNKRSAPFEELSNSQKRRRTADVRQESLETLVYATKSTLMQVGKRNSATLLTESLKSPGRAIKILKSYKSSNQFKKMSSDEALVLALDTQLTKNQYLRLRRNSKQFGADIYPNYQELSLAKSRCYAEGSKIDANSIYCSLQSLLVHAAKRLVLCLSQQSLPEEISIQYKLGFDGSSGQSEFKHMLEGESVSDSSVYITTIVPIRLIAEKNKSILWQNPSPSSTRYCRPVRIAYEKETVELIKQEYNRIKSEINNLCITEVSSPPTRVKHSVLITMIDCKTVNAIENIKSTQMCYICKVGSNKMGDIINRDIIGNLENMDVLKYGVSPLHARIKFMEFILHIAYRFDLPIERRKKNTRLNDKEKELVGNRKKNIQNNFRKKLNLLVDIPKQGFGSSNDGNTARRFFEKYDISSEITGVKKELIYKFYILLMVINSSHSTDSKAFRKFTEEIISILKANYYWWSMSPTVHKVLIHGHQIINCAILPLGLLSEEAQEHRNKDFKYFKSKFARKCSRQDNLTDIFNRFMLTSDPYIAHFREATKVKSKHEKLPEEVQNLIKTNDGMSSSDIDASDFEDEII